MTTFDLTSDRMVFAGTLFGETRGCGRAAMENVAQVILNRVADNWNPGGIQGVCLARLQFSCWNHDDPNRQQILDAPFKHTEAGMWAMCLSVADAAMARENPDRVSGADCYFARSMPAAPYWAKPPAKPVFADNAHAFWLTRIGPHAPLRSVHSVAQPLPVPLTADELNQRQLNQLHG